MNKEINKFYQCIMQEVSAMQQANEDGDSKEQTFTRYATDLLSLAGETENVYIAYDERDLGRNGKSKINGYAISDNYETVDLFISIFKTEDDLYDISKKEIDEAIKRITYFFRNTMYGYMNVAESSPIFEFVNALTSYKELRDNLIRVNAFVFTNANCKVNTPKSQTIANYKVFYDIVDINFLYRISEQSHIPIEIDFDQEGFEIPCLSTKDSNDKYQVYIAILPGQCLANLYERYGSRLLEQNVRSFLQFTGKINKGIRQTIKKEPHMFLAYNNGIAATADDIEQDKGLLKKINNLQIVNGGQTTASIYHTMKKDKADISNIYVQVKFSIIKDKENFGKIVSRISRYANTQNKVNDADFSANNDSLVALEKLSRYTLAPINSNRMRTYWFFERARGQYKNFRQKEGFTSSRRKAFDLKYPKIQMFTKVELAKYINAYQEVYNGKKIIVGPHVVVRGNEKNYAIFISDNLPTNVNTIDNIYYEDCIAKAILFKTADKLYGTKRSQNNIGQMRNVVVPYTISLLNIITDNRLDLYKIWKQQQISKELSDFIYDLMKKVNKFIIDKAPTSHYIEWAKKEECWKMVKNNTWTYCVENIANELIDKNNPPQRKKIDLEDNNEEIVKHDIGIIKSIPYTLWKEISQWGEDTKMLTMNQISVAASIANKLQFNKPITDRERTIAINIYEIVYKNNLDLLLKAEEYKNKERLAATAQQKTDINLELLQRMVAWDRKERILEDWKFKIMNDVVKGERQLTDRLKDSFYKNLLELKRNGFHENE